MTASPWSHQRRSTDADDIDFEIRGQELQFVEIELDPGESAVAEAGAMVWKDASIGMTTVFGDGSGGQDGGFMGKLLGAGRCCAWASSGRQRSSTSTNEGRCNMGLDHGGPERPSPTG